MKKRLGKFKKGLGKFTVRGSSTVMPFKENHKYLCGLRIFSGFFACKYVKVSAVKGIK